MKQRIEADLKAKNQTTSSIVHNSQLFKTNSLGIMKVKFKLSLYAEQCIELMEGRWFENRKLKCFWWDGKTDYRQEEETLDDKQKRIQEFGEWLESKN